jgi:hypothetical protein
MTSKTDPDGFDGANIDRESLPEDFIKGAPAQIFSQCLSQSLLSCSRPIAGQI